MFVLASLFPVGKLYDDVVADDGRQHAFICLAAFVIAFLLIRTSARMTRRFTWWPGGVQTEGGVHLHHLVWGICLMLVAGFIGVSLKLDEPWGGILAGAFGVGAGLTFDEFALWTRLEDVYWSQEGRSSIQAVGFVAVLGTLIVAGVQPFTLDNPGSALAVSGAIALTLLIALAAFLKRRIVLGAVGLFVVPVGLVAALRLAHPTSPWAHWFYPAGCSRLRRAQERFDDPSRLSARLSCRLMDMVGGRPSDTNSG
ncbi:MAG TPA: hypothetical protein VH256_09530 [Thermoleophilaceae bacterium]|jgi:hypothetical protein|nr:hypothetical protein [Thermoleophilaceae bacterium]